jgi:hypothetical protein
METKQAGKLAEAHRLILTSKRRLKHSKEDASSFIHLLVTSTCYKCFIHLFTSQVEKILRLNFGASGPEDVER